VPGDLVALLAVSLLAVSLLTVSLLVDAAPGDSAAVPVAPTVATTVAATVTVAEAESASVCATCSCTVLGGLLRRTGDRDARRDCSARLSLSPSTFTHRAGTGAAGGALRGTLGLQFRV